jgi:hypothetical protein
MLRVRVNFVLLGVRADVEASEPEKNTLYTPITIGNQVFNTGVRSKIP